VLKVQQSVLYDQKVLLKFIIFQPSKIDVIIYSQQPIAKDYIEIEGRTFEMNYFEESLKFHEKNVGKIEVVSKVKVETRDDLSLAYTPGVAEPCRKIYENE
jgi:hypothetical protein